MTPIRIIISYCHANREWLECDGEPATPKPRCLLTQWERALSDRGVVIWFDREHSDGLHGGEEWEQRIYNEIDRADIAILLMTQDFILSPFIRNKELPRIMDRYRSGGLLVLPISTQPSRERDLERSGLLTLQWTPDLSSPLSKIEERSRSAFEEAKIQVLDALELLVEMVEGKRKRAVAAAAVKKHISPTNPSEKTKRDKTRDPRWWDGLDGFEDWG